MEKRNIKIQNSNGNEFELKLVFRPGLADFLKRIGEHFEIIIFNSEREVFT